MTSADICGRHIPNMHFRFSDLLKIRQAIAETEKEGDNQEGGGRRAEGGGQKYYILS